MVRDWDGTYHAEVRWEVPKGETEKCGRPMERMREKVSALASGSSIVSALLKRPKTIRRQSMDNDNWNGAGAVPYSVEGGKVYFLLQETKGGKKEGYLVDFGGGRKKGVDYSLSFCAAREFSEETAGLFTADDPKALATELAILDHHAIEEHQSVKNEVLKCHELVKQAEQLSHCATSDTNRSPWYGSYAIRLPHRDLTAQNVFFGDSSLRKVRVFHWIESSLFTRLLNRETIAGTLPLHERLFCLLNLPELTKSIINQYENTNNSKATE